MMSSHTLKQGVRSETLRESIEKEVHYLESLIAKAEAWNREWEESDSDRRIELLGLQAEDFAELISRQARMDDLGREWDRLIDAVDPEEVSILEDLARRLTDGFRGLKRIVDRNMARAQEAWHDTDRELKQVRKDREAMAGYESPAETVPYCIDHTT